MQIVDTVILIDSMGVTNTQTSSNLVKEGRPNELANVEPQIAPGKFSQTDTWKTLYTQIINGIKKCEWPEHTGSFTLYDQKQGNGVKPIKEPCMEYLQSQGWELETYSRVATAIKPGAIDATIPIGNKLFCVEWETGNISSSHRALNKLSVGLIQGDFIGGVLIVPSRAMYYYLTDRIGNIREIEPYFPIFKAIRIIEGILSIIVIEHDQISKDVPPIPKGYDGNSLNRKNLIKEGRYIAKSKIKRRPGNNPSSEISQQLDWNINEDNIENGNLL
jgi:hypothetical protein